MKRKFSEHQQKYQQKTTPKKTSTMFLQPMSHSPEVVPTQLSFQTSLKSFIVEESDVFHLW